MKSLTNPPQSCLLQRSDVLSKCSPGKCLPPPEQPGLYAWFFKDIPGNTPTKGYITKDNLTLLYVGICPRNNTGKTKRGVLGRIGTHYNGNTKNSTLRLTLGALLNYDGEKKLNDWMEKNAYVCWISHQAPWEIEKKILKVRGSSLLFNIKGNKDNPFREKLMTMRKEAKARQEAKKN